MIKSLYTFLFSDCERYYLFNSKSRFYSEISQELYYVLHNGDIESLPEDVKNKLKEQEIIVNESDKYDFYYSELMHFNASNYDLTSLSLIIVPTTSCNFDCPYCFEPKLNPKTISEDAIESLVNFVRSQKNIKHLLLTWYGGEPLIAFEKIKEIYRCLNEDDMPDIVDQSIVTNGYCFNRDVINFFKQQGLNHIQITLDGIKERHDQTRCLKESKKPTFDVIWENIRNIVKELPQTKVVLRVNINKKNYKDYAYIVKRIKDEFPKSANIEAYPGLIREETTDKRSLCDSSFSNSETIELRKLLHDEGLSYGLFPYRKVKGCMMHTQNSYIVGPECEIYKFRMKVRSLDIYRMEYCISQIAHVI